LSVLVLVLVLVLGVGAGRGLGDWGTGGLGDWAVGRSLETGVDGDGLWATLSGLSSLAQFQPLN
jgi:hypothetical protein